jgi:hypothetical protein
MEKFILILIKANDQFCIDSNFSKLIIKYILYVSSKGLINKESSLWKGLVCIIERIDSKKTGLANLLDKVL